MAQPIFAGPARDGAGLANVDASYNERWNPINDFLLRRPARRFCDTCIRKRLDLKWAQQLQVITATLPVTDALERCLGRCCTGKEVKQVIQAAAATELTERTFPGLPARD